jgi:hypothetical protein
MGYRVLSSQIEEEPETTPDERVLATRLVCSKAKNGADARMLLDMLGLDPLEAAQALGRAEQEEAV